MYVESDKERHEEKQAQLETEIQAQKANEQRYSQSQAYIRARLATLVSALIEVFNNIMQAF